MNKGRKKEKKEEGRKERRKKGEREREKNILWMWWPHAQLDLGAYMSSLNLVTVSIPWRCLFICHFLSVTLYRQ